MDRAVAGLMNETDRCFHHDSRPIRARFHSNPPFLVFSNVLPEQRV
jgi:hypothetical protein